MNLTGPGLTAVTVFTQRLLRQSCESHWPLLPPGFSLSFTGCWSSSSQPQQPCVLGCWLIKQVFSPLLPQSWILIYYLLWTRENFVTRHLLISQKWPLNLTQLLLFFSFFTLKPSKCLILLPLTSSTASYTSYTKNEYVVSLCFGKFYPKASAFWAN